MNEEREAKLIVGSSYRLPDLGSLVDGVRVTPVSIRTLRTTYLDTEDLRLARWGCSLRWRDAEGWTVKLPSSRRGDALVRGEFRFDGSSDEAPDAAVDLLRAYVRTSELVPSVRLRTVRARIGLCTAEGRAAGEVVDDEVSVLNGRRVASRFREIEIELAPDAPDELLEAVLERLRAAGAGEPSFTPKYVRALGTRAELPPELVTELPRPPAALTVEDLVHVALSLPAVDLLRNDAGVRIGDDPEAVHKMRVATRRLRSDLRTFRPVLDQVWVEPLRGELGWLGTELGAVRDADVMLDGLREAAGDLPGTDRAAAARVLDKLARQRDASLTALRASMSSKRYVKLLDDVVAAGVSPMIVPGVAQDPATSLRRLMDRPWRRLKRRCGKLGPRSADAELHRARILAKRARYAADALAPAFGRRAGRFAEAAADLQDVLGEQHDAVVAAAWLRSAAIGSSPAVAFAAGLMSAKEHGVARTKRASWRRAWKRLDRPKSRFWR